MTQIESKKNLSQTKSLPKKSINQGRTGKSRIDFILGLLKTATSLTADACRCGIIKSIEEIPMESEKRLFLEHSSFSKENAFKVTVEAPSLDKVQTLVDAVLTLQKMCPQASLMLTRINVFEGNYHVNGSYWKATLYLDTFWRLS